MVKKSRKDETIRDSDIRDALKNILELERLPFNVRKHYREVYHHPGSSDVPCPSKVYKTGGLIVSVEAELADVIKPLGSQYPANGIFLATPKLIARYKKEYKRDQGIRRYGVTEKGSIWQGPIVDRADDTNLETMHAKSVLVQYSGRDLSTLVGPEWELFIPKVAEHFGVSVAMLDVNSSYIASLDEHGHLVVSSDTGAKAFSMLITEKKQLEPGINDVYHAGQTIEKVIGSRVREMEMIMRSGN